MKTNFFVLFLAICVFLSALALVTKREETRNLSKQLEKIESQRRSLKQDWAKLILRQSNLASHSRVEQVARDALGMKLPETKTVVSAK
jgi:cell division protein FtsL